MNQTSITKHYVLMHAKYAGKTIDIAVDVNKYEQVKDMHWEIDYRDNQYLPYTLIDGKMVYLASMLLGTEGDIVAINGLYHDCRLANLQIPKDIGVATTTKELLDNMAVVQETIGYTLADTKPVPKKPTRRAKKR